MSRAVIICGAKIKEYKYVASAFKNGDFFVYCDSGLKHIDGFLAVGVEAKPKLIIGDFDSHELPDTTVETIVLPKEKDDTDSVYAVKECIKRGFDEILLAGVIGGRLDHSLVNVYALKLIYESGVRAEIVDDYGFISLIGPKEAKLIDPSCSYFSLVAIDSDAEGVSIENAKYNLENAVIKSSYQYATSNEVAGDLPAKVYVEKGFLLLIRVYRE